MTTPSNAELRRTVERLIIENRNSLNDPTTNEPYDVKGIADDVIELIQAREQKLLTELLEELPEKVGYFVDTEPELSVSQQKIFGDGYNEALDQVVSAIERYREGL